MEMADQRAENNVVSDQPQNSIADFDPPKKPKTKKFVVACAVLASMTSILLGYDIGVMSGASLFIKENLNISDVQVEVLNGTLNIYSLIGSALADKTSDWIGRRYTIVLAGTIFFIGALLMGFAPNYAFLMFGRFIAGVGVGYALMIAPVYTAEISPASFRGFLTSFPKCLGNTIIIGEVLPKFQQNLRIYYNLNNINESMAAHLKRLFTDLYKQCSNGREELVFLQETASQLPLDTRIKGVDLS
nr:polyol transporter 5-like [Malus domestica]